MANQLARRIVKAQAHGAVAQASVFEGVAHDGTRGRLREIVLTELIRPLLPPIWRVSSGIICDSNDKVSKDKTEHQSGQEDLIIYDPQLLPPFFERAEQSIVPIESCLAVIEVKSTINATEVKRTIEHAQKIRQLTSTLNWRQPPNDPIAKRFLYPVHHLFAFGTDLTGNTKTEWQRISEQHEAIGATDPLLYSACIVGSSTWLCSRELDQLTHSYTTDADKELSEILAFVAIILDITQRVHRARIQMDVPMFHRYIT